MVSPLHSLLICFKNIKSLFNISNGQMDKANYEFEKCLRHTLEEKIPPVKERHSNTNVIVHYWASKILCFVQMFTSKVQILNYTFYGEYLIFGVSASCCITFRSHCQVNLLKALMVSVYHCWTLCESCNDSTVFLNISYDLMPPVYMEASGWWSWHI